MLPTGARHGVFCAWQLEWNGCVFAIVRRPHFSESMLSVHVELRSLPLMQEGGEPLWRRFVQVLATLGFRVVRNVLGRVDLCGDLPDVPVKEIATAYAAGCFINPGVRDRKDSRKSCGAMHHGFEPGDWQSFDRGKGGPTMVRVYDKLKEVTGDLAKWAVLVAKRWGGVPKAATRVEFQLRRDCLRENFDIVSVEDYFGKRGLVAEWVTKHWFRVTSSRPDRKNRNQARAELHPVWKRVQECFAAWAGKPVGERFQVERAVTKPSQDRMAKQMLGLFASSLGLRGELLPPCGQAVFAAAKRWWDEILAFNLDSGFAARVQERADAFRVKTGLLSTA